MLIPQEYTEALTRNFDRKMESAVRHVINLRGSILLLEDLQANFVRSVLAEQLAIFRRNLAIAEKQIVEMQIQKNTLLEKSEQANSTPKSSSVYSLSVRP